MGCLKKIRVLSFATFQSLLMGLIGIVCGILYSFGGLIIDILVSVGLLSATAMSTPGLSYGTVLAFGALIGMPLIFATFGFISGLIGAYLYNIFSRKFGLIKTDFFDKSDRK